MAPSPLVERWRADDRAGSVAGTYGWSPTVRAPAHHDQPNGAIGLPHLAGESLSLADAGMLAEAAALAEQAVDLRPSERVWGTLVGARTHLLMGHLDTAEAAARQGMVAADRSRQPSARRLGLSLVLACLGQRGDAGGVAELLPRLLALEPDAGVLREEKAIGVAWGLRALGRTREAIDVLLDGAADAAMRGMIGSEALLRHEALRLGDATQAPPLARLAEHAGSKLTEVRAAHAHAIEDRDAAGLMAASEVFARWGADLCAAEAATAAVALLERDGRRWAAGRQRARVARLLARCGGASTPGLLTDDRVAVTLSAREREIAGLAATGLTSREIATRLFLSSRTVENHLQHVYTKLDVAGRSELVRALGRA